MARGNAIKGTELLRVAVAAIVGALTMRTWWPTVKAKAKTMIGRRLTQADGEESARFHEGDLVELSGEYGTTVQAWLDERGAVLFPTGYDPDTEMVELTAQFGWLDSLGIHRITRAVMFCDANDVIKLDVEQDDS